MPQHFLLLLLTISALFGGGLNKLAKSESPYLLQHATNPVYWYPYTNEAFSQAVKEDKLIFLSIGYSTCHWCHVMEEESFTDANISKLLNDDYISIKVDKEEMPDIDVKYQDIHALFHNGKNGWPLTLILTPQKEVMFVAMYVPAQDNYGMDGLQSLLPKMVEIYKDKKKLQSLLDKNRKIIKQNSQQKDIKVDGNLTTAFVSHMEKRYDKSFKGFDKRPRFPMASHLNILLKIYLLNGDKQAYTMVKETVDAMATGGIYDQIEGAFFRYTTYQDWVIPHYEKMLYTNAELIPIYVKMYQLMGEKRYKKVVDETIAEFMQKFQSNHLFYAASDADSEHGEGRYFLYTQEEVEEVLKKASYTKEEIEQTLEYFDIAEIGNVRDEYNNVHFHTDFDKPVAKVEQTKKLLLEIRKPRRFPYIDKKIITAWNAMMIKALFIASKIDEKYKKIAKASMGALLDKLYKDGVLYHQYLEGTTPTKIALLEDYAFVIDALLTGYQTTFDKEYLSLATKLTHESIAKFYDNKIWYLNQTGEKIPSQYNDKYYTTPLARHFHNMLTVANLNYDLKLLKQAKGFIKNERQKILNNMGKSPEAMWALIRLGYEDIVLKTNKTNFATFHKQIDKIKHPFLLKKVEKTDMFLLCNESSCFFYDKNISKVINKIEKKK